MKVIFLNAAFNPLVKSYKLSVLWCVQGSVRSYKTNSIGVFFKCYSSQWGRCVLLIRLLIWNISWPIFCSASFVNFISLLMRICCPTLNLAIILRTWTFFFFHVRTSESVNCDGAMPVVDWAVSLWVLKDFGRASIYLCVFV